MLTFIIVELTTRTPLLEVRLFADRTFTISVVVGCMLGAGMFGSLYVLPIFAQEVMHYTAMKSGVMIMSTGLLMMPVL